ncbi:hypothetical protein M413DRAFT_443262 [Hebeloma cylindrosporum]|uniref:SigF-like NTF2-like domain-containing protein n=1 Tax=Hebeloma cylindrosporum TaxID=76867 RepID=A0A0C3C5V4_HEBCY|nr:hypothetical protein M413DRAFT_443262 [Hebeloma cylindrosporum h7]
MENPVKEIVSIVQQLVATDSPNVQKAALETYMTPDVAFRHPVCVVESHANSRDTLLGIYQWARVLSPRVEIKVDSIVFDENRRVMYLESVQWFKLFFLPTIASPARLITRLTLREKNGLYYISQQEDFYHPEDFAALLVPAITPVIRKGLNLGTVLSNLFVRGANMLGYWRPYVNDAYAASDAGLYDNED